MAKIGDDLYVLDGHRRFAAAKRAGIDVPYRILPDSEIWARYPSGQVQEAGVSMTGEP
ncbi:hypothetical protein ABTX60_04230 [Streptomyces sp. NPDC126510]|uniref:hypothetical protein n=1 Tax=Streptomyces sp. NPDC126510 TaxID=3155317 RepID=UPI00331B1AF1